ncbi:PH domain-containing protein [Salinicoccus halitifaciens]|uniref:Membrane protein YdbS with pleckstrin-like domain n=1 Tax=Salinicoccus halitifaciens TaxID=1073415 RepID=A0ABV2E956_9STAP|nr:PH domain-containing protein [Salinicoccus halitifaciens]MCD2138100.1 PH domain-containing protein [Salinicoccus halitifaciens]
MKRLSSEAVPYMRVRAMIDMLFWFIIAGAVTGLSLWFDWPAYVIWSAAGIFIVLFIINVIIRPLIFYRVTRYELAEEQIIVKKGFIIIRTTLIPIKRIQGVELSTGPVSRRYGLSILRAKTASMGIDMPPIEISEGGQLKKQIIDMVKEEISDV